MQVRGLHVFVTGMFWAVVEAWYHSSATGLTKVVPYPLTDPQMTRFLLTLPQAIDLVFYITFHGKSGNLYVRKMPACTIGMLAEVMSKAITKQNNYPIE